MHAPSDRHPVVSVVVVNYNGLNFLAPFFDSLAHAFERHTAEVIVVDNASTDGSLAWLRERTDIRLVESPVNTGFTGGNNLGATFARGQVLLLLNNDTEVHGPLDTLIDEALADGVGGAGCRLHYGDGRLQMSIGLEHTAARIVLSWLGLEKRAWAPSLMRKFEVRPAVYARYQPDVAWLSGACFATRRDVWDRLGGFDADLFMYCEDVDYAFRARRLGLRLAYMPAPVVTHYEGGGKAWVGAAALRRTSRSYFIFTGKATGRGTARALGAALAAVFALRGIAFSARATLAHGARHALQRDKAAGYRSAAWSLFEAARTGRVPPLG